MLAILVLAIATQPVPKLLPSDHILKSIPAGQRPDPQRLSSNPSMWQPSIVEVIRAKAALYKYLSSDPRPVLLWERTPQQSRVTLDDYVAQYLGTSIDTVTGHFVPVGTKVIIIHGERKDLVHREDDLDNIELRVMDGGKGFFDAYYDPQSGKLLMFSFHGLA